VSLWDAAGRASGSRLDIPFQAEIGEASVACVAASDSKEIFAHVRIVLDFQLLDGRNGLLDIAERAIFRSSDFEKALGTRSAV
jgi:hypothetical protein